MWATMILGDVKSMYDLYRGLAALIIAKRYDKSINLVVHGEIPYMGRRFDHIAYKIDIPIQVNGLLKSNNPLMIIEDSSSSRRLRNRRKELESLDMPIEYLYINPVNNKHLILSLKISEENNLYMMEVGV